ncbi:MAG: TIR domain-containing protein [Methylomarinum sp.]|nr:TIR domain-containing protein [Methylomarinum sp.]
MPVFISYSHSDEEFVNLLAANLVKRNTHIWLDTWNLNVGDSLISKVQEAIEESSALLIILSKSSVESEWCKKELNSALMRELDEKKVIVLPVLLEDCKVPLFLKEKMYADFKTSFDKGLSAIVDALAKINNYSQSRIQGGEYHVDWGMDWSIVNGLFEMEFTIIEQSKDAPFSCMTQIKITCNKAATARYNQYQSIGLNWMGHFLFTKYVADSFQDKEAFFILENPLKQTHEITIKDNKNNLEFNVKTVSRRLGEDTGKNIVVNISKYIKDISGYVQATTRQMTEEENLRLQSLLATR